MNPTIEYNGEEMVLVDGILSELHVAETTVNVLEQIQKRSRQKNLAKEANCKTISLNWPASRKRDFPSRFRYAGRILVGYGGGIMVNLIQKTWRCRTASTFNRLC